MDENLIVIKNLSDKINILENEIKNLENEKINYIKYDKKNLFDQLDNEYFKIFLQKKKIDLSNKLIEFIAFPIDFIPEKYSTFIVFAYFIIFCLLLFQFPVFFLFFLVTPLLLDIIEYFLNKIFKPKYTREKFKLNFEGKDITDPLELLELKNKLSILVENEKNQNNLIEIEYKEALNTAQKKINDLKYELKVKEKESFEFWKKLNGIEFESNITNLLKSLSLNAKKTRSTNDEGIDIKIEWNNIVIGVQCKHYSKSYVTPKEIREFQGATEYAKKSIFIGSNGFSFYAMEQAKKSNMFLLDLNDILKLQKKEEKAVIQLLNYIKD